MSASTSAITSTTINKQRVANCYVLGDSSVSSEAFGILIISQEAQSWRTKAFKVME
jgi:hypothetical protein